MRIRHAGLVVVILVFAASSGLFPVTGNATLDNLRPAPAAAQYNDAVNQWRPIVQDACGVGTWCETRIMQLIACESGGNPNAVSAAINPGTGMHDYGLLQISPIWGDIAYADGASQIYWAAPRLGSVWWAC